MAEVLAQLRVMKAIRRRNWTPDFQMCDIHTFTFSMILIEVPYWYTHFHFLHDTNGSAILVIANAVINV